MSKVRLTMELPKVGDRLVRVMTATSFGVHATFEPKECVVVYANERHHWYTVKFIDSGIMESFGVPIIDHSIARGWKPGTIPVVCVETGMAYSTISQCSRDTNVPKDEISRQISGKCNYRTLYHFIKVL